MQRPCGIISMNRRSFAQFQEQLEVYNSSKQDVAMFEESISHLKQTEESLRRQHNSILRQFQKEEQKAGISGFQDVNDKLHQTSKETDSLNKLKSQTLDKISDIVQRAGAMKKQDLVPKVCSQRIRHGEYLLDYMSVFSKQASYHNRKLSN